MADERLVFYRRHLETVGSTNQYARDEADALFRAAAGCNAVVVTADTQTAGRGQRGNVWQSCSGQNLLASILLRPKFFKADERFLLSQLTALSVRAALVRFGVEAKLKWPNDVYVGRRKICGILIEADYTGNLVEQAIIGVGINVNQTDFPIMDKIPVSMRMLTGGCYSVENILSALLEAFSHYYSLLEAGGILQIRAEYMSALMGVGEQLTYSDAAGDFVATVAGVRGDGCLLLQRPDGTQKYYAFKEVELKL